MKKLFVVAVLVFCLSAPFVFNTCGSPREPVMSEGFAIYLTKDNIPPSQMPALSHVEIADTPVISAKDIVSYDSATHKIVLTDAAYVVFYQQEASISGITFVVCVDKAPIYWGAFWHIVSSQSFNGVVIRMPPFENEAGFEHSFQITLGYPSTGFFTGEDPRSNPAIMQSLAQSGKLK